MSKTGLKKRLNIISKTDEVLSELDASIPEYIKAVGEFQYEGESYRLVDHYRSEVFLNCQVCGHERIKDIYVVADSSGKTSKVGNVCIDKISNQKIHEWFTSYKQKRDNIEKNRELIDSVDGIIVKYDYHCLPIKISKMGISRLRKMLDRMCHGIEPLEKTTDLARYYIRKMPARS